MLIEKAQKCAFFCCKIAQKIAIQHRLLKLMICTVCEDYSCQRYQNKRYLSANKAYFDLEKQTDTRHEYIDGYVYAMVGGSFNHGTLVGAIAGEIRNHLKGKPCRVFSESIKVKIPSIYNAKQTHVIFILMWWLIAPLIKPMAICSPRLF
jgi:Uma2 family endonuclease